jgi:hypothetical protein
MSFPPKKPFNPQVSSIPVLDSSSGNPRAFQDPNSVASLGLRIQASSDQIKADTLYDPPPPLNEGFRNEVYSPWILGTEACKKEGFNATRFNPSNTIRGYTGLAILGFLALYFSFRKGR